MGLIASELDLKTLERTSVQDKPTVENNVLPFFAYYGTRGELLPRFGTREREKALRELYRRDWMYMIQGAFSGVAKKVAALPWEIRGSEEGQYNTDYFQGLLRNADFGDGWARLLTKGILDYLRQDAGWFMEIIAPGNPRRPPTGAVMGLAHLDSLRCVPTGDPEFPVVYWDRKNKPHVLHHTRVIRIQDMPDGDEVIPGYGNSALSRAVSIAEREILMGQYIQGRLDDKPPPGIVIAGNINRQQRDTAVRTYLTENAVDAGTIWGRQLWFYGMDAGTQPTFETIAFAQSPDNFDYRTYTEINIDALALALGVDRQELWQLSGGNIGSGQQSAVLHQKSRGKTIGFLLTEIERKVNDILPEEFEFTFSYRDESEAEAEAQKASVWASTIATIRSDMTSEETRILMANQIEAVRDAITDDNGEINRVDDADVQPNRHGQIVDDATEGTPEQDMTSDDTETPDQQKAVAEKTWEITRATFVASVGNLFSAALNTNVTPRTKNSFKSGLRNLLRLYGTDAFRDGLLRGGVNVQNLDDDDLTAVMNILVDQSQYIDKIATEMYDKKTFPAGQVARRAQMWANKSLEPFLNAGMLSANRNMMVRWDIDPLKDNCTDCLRLNGQVHRLKTFMGNGWIPKSQKLECKGFDCGCGFVPTLERARGRF